jgi:2,3-bisphosphoglycerate-independent phosphoglycerate mutase
VARPMDRLDLLARIAQPADTKMVLLVLDGVGDLVTSSQPETALERARTPHLDALAARSALGRIVPVARGVTPGSGPGHLALFGYDPSTPEADIGRGVLEALGVDVDDFELAPGDVAARGNFATADADGNLTDRRAGRPPTEENRRLVAKLRRHLEENPVEGVDVTLVSGEQHRFVLVLRGERLSAHLADTDPQEEGEPPKRPEPYNPLGEPGEHAAETAEKVGRVIDALHAGLAGEETANRVLLRGFSTLPHLPPVTDLYRLRAGAFAGYPLYRGVAKACGMTVVPCGKPIGEVLDAVESRWDDFDYFFCHVKKTDSAGEDGDLDTKVKVIEEVDEALPRLLKMGPDVVAITGDHSTPAPMEAHSWHPVPLLLHGPHCFIDRQRTFDEHACTLGHLGTFPSRELMGLMLANADRLAKYGA